MGIGRKASSHWSTHPPVENFWLRHCLGTFFVCKCSAFRGLGRPVSYHSFNVARGLEERCKLLHAAGRGGARPPNNIWCIVGVKMLHLARASLANSKVCLVYHESGRLKMTGTAFRSSKKDRNVSIRTLLYRDSRLALSKLFSSR